jgi:oxalate decarboxylase
MSFKYQLEASTPQRFGGGTLRTVTRKNIPSLRDMALYSESIDPGSLREVHWHPNTGELAYCLEGQGTFSILSPLGDNDTFQIDGGSVAFVPNGYAHYILNTGSQPLRMVLAFTHEDPEHIDLSETLDHVPKDYLAETFGVTPTDFPQLSYRGDIFLAKVAQATTEGSAASLGPHATKPYATKMEETPLKTFEGGTVNELSIQQIPHLKDITLYWLRGQPHSLREPHWHPQTAELNYCVKGTAQIGVVAPNGGRETFKIAPGDVAFIPANYFHYIASTSDEPLEFLVFFSNTDVLHIDLSQVFDYFPREVIAASFGLNKQAFETLSKRGDIFMAAKREASDV